MEFHLSRNGEIFGTFTLEQIRHGLKDGTILNSDFAWKDGMDEWKTLSHVIPPAPPALPPPSPQTSSPGWRSDVATERQIAYLKDFGVSVPEGLTKGDASELLDKLTNDDDALARLQDNRMRKAEEEEKRRALHPSFYMRQDIADAERELEEAEPSGRKDCRDDLKWRKSLRIDFWRATCNGNWISLDNWDDLIGYADAIAALYNDFGQYFKIPARKRVQDILDALDAGAPGWDIREPHAFFATLQANFPDSERAR